MDRYRASILRDTFRESDTIARIAGDESIVLVVDALVESIKKIPSRLRKNLKKFNADKERSFKISLSMGVIYFDPNNPRPLDKLMAEADRAMYQHKKMKMP